MFQTEVVAKIKTHILCKLFFFSENRAVYEVMWKKRLSSQTGHGYNIVRDMRIACWIPKAINAHLEYIMLIYFPLPRLLHERASVLRYTYIACIVFIYSLRFA